MPIKTEQATRLYVIVPCDIRDRLLPEHSEAFGLYTRLSDAVTCQVPHGDKHFGLVLGGTSMSQAEWAVRLHTTRSALQRGLKILKKEKLVVTRRGQYDTRIALTDCVKKTKRRGTIQQYPWLLVPSDTSDVTQADGDSDASVTRQLCPISKQLRPLVTQLDSPKSAQVAEGAMTWEEQHAGDKKVEKKVERGRSLSLLSENFTATDEHRAIAAQQAVNVDTALKKFKAFHTSKGTRCDDWDAKFTLWLLNEWPEKPGSKKPQPVEMTDPVEELRKQIRSAKA